MQVIKVIIIVILLLASMVGVILGSGYLAANNPLDNSHKHELTLVEESAPTCVAPGYRKHYACTGCEDVFADENGFAKLDKATITITPYGHNVTSISCTEARICSICNQVANEAPGHTAVIDAAIAATCTTNGKTEGSHCSVCGEVLTAQLNVSATGHSYDSNSDFECNECGYVRTAEECPHMYENLSSMVTPPTCTETGYTTYTCTCGFFYTSDEVAALGHSEVDDAAVEPGCLANGLTVGKHCSVCDEVTVPQMPVNAKGIHAWDGLTCSDCGATKFEAETANIVYVMPEGESRVVSTGREGKTLEATNYPSGDAFVYFMSYSDYTTLTFYVTASKAGKATVSVRMGCATSAAELKNLFSVKVNGVDAESYANVVFPSYREGSKNYYDWLELEISDIDLIEGANTIEIVKPYTGEYTSKSGLNFDYMAICPEDSTMTLQDTRDFTVGGHSFATQDVVAAPSYTTGGEIRVYCENCRTCQVVTLPAISVENGYTKAADNVLTSVWEYTYNGSTYSFTVEEATQKYTFSVVGDQNPFAEANGGSVIANDATVALKEESGATFYGNSSDYNTTYTMKIYSSEATTVRFIIGSAKKNASSFAPSALILNLKVDGSSDAVTYNTAKFKWGNDTSNWFTFKDFEVANIQLHEGENTITFQIKNSLNVQYVTFEAKVPVEIRKQTEN